ncbi:adenine phosphoribosyltransferase, partial [Myriangium duriaei CBS 260.36]
MSAPPSHGHPDSTGLNTQKDDKPSTASHPPRSKPDPTLNADQGRLASAPSTGSSELANLEVRLRSAIRQFHDFPQKGILFEDILPIFANPSLHHDLIAALELRIQKEFPQKPDVIVALESRGFLFGPALALNLGASFVPVRKKGKLPGPCETEGFEKEYGKDFFQLQSDSIKPGQKVVVVDDLIATGGSAACAGNLVRKLGGELLGFVFLMELTFLDGRSKLGAPCVTLLAGQEEKKQDGKAELPLGRTQESADQIKPVTDAGGAAATSRP